MSCRPVLPALLRAVVARVLAALWAALVWLLATPAFAGDGDADAGATSCLGRWVGIGNNGGANWTIDMVVEPASAAGCGTIEYPSLGCGGTLERCEPADAGALVVSERYTHNPGTCAPAGTIEMACYGDEMRWRWIGIAVVTTTLRRVPGSGPEPATSGSIPSASTPRPSDGPPPRTRDTESGGPPPRTGSGVAGEAPAPAPTARPSRESRSGCSCRLVAVRAGDGADAESAALACGALLFAYARARGRARTRAHYMKFRVWSDDRTRAASASKPRRRKRF